MLFNSIEFLLFFPIVTILYFLLPHKVRWLHLLLASCIFYMFFVPIYIVILFGTIIVDYFAGILIENAEGKKKRWFLVMSLVANIGVLAVFKYYNFFIGNIDDALHFFGIHADLPLLKILLPIGLSFHTFQAMSYTIEIYREEQKAERHFGVYALYVMFYPQLVAGPIERPQNMLHQFHEHHKLDYDNVARGLRQMLWGIVKKVVIADRLGLVTVQIFDKPHVQSGIGIMIGAIFFIFQIFCDFSGYSDIAIGAARVMGFKLMTNFNHPFHSRSISEFWKRWHISLSTWFNDYLYMPIVYGLRKHGNLAVIVAVLVTFLISGFWHGADWQYILWGLFLGLVIVYEILTKHIRAVFFSKLPRGLGNFIALATTFTYIFVIGIFFRAKNAGDAFYMIRKLASVPGELIQIMGGRKMGFLHLPNLYNFVFPGFALIFFLELTHVLDNKFKLKETFGQRPTWVRWSLYYTGLILLLFFGVYEKQQFIYYQF
jgi:alginate O-acetyltransferase complex protein AlgI